MKMNVVKSLRTGVTALAMVCAGALVSAQTVGKTIVMLHFDGSTVKDECGNVCTVYGNPSISSANAKVGGGAISFSNGQYVDVAGGLELGSDDWTIDWWEYRTGASGRNNVWSTMRASGGTTVSSASGTYLSYTMDVGDSIKFGLFNAPSDVSWSSSNSSVVSVNSKGKLSALRAGTATITATSGSATVRIRIRVED